MAGFRPEDGWEGGEARESQMQTRGGRKQARTVVGRLKGLPDAEGCAAGNSKGVKAIAQTMGNKAKLAVLCGRSNALEAGRRSKQLDGREARRRGVAESSCVDLLLQIHHPRQLEQKMRSAGRPGRQIHCDRAQRGCWILRREHAYQRKVRLERPGGRPSGMEPHLNSSSSSASAAADALVDLGAEKRKSSSCALEGLTAGTRNEEKSSSSSALAAVLASERRKCSPCKISLAHSITAAGPYLQVEVSKKMQPTQHS
eukprot:6180921-Pleurochrysis_carterae.AAC.1